MKLLAAAAALVIAAAAALPVSAEGVLGIRVGDAYGKPGDKLPVEISFEDNPGIVAVKLTLSYDETALRIADEDFKTVWTEGSYVYPKEDGAYNPSSPMSFSWFTPGSNAEDTGEFTTLTFEILDTAEPGEYPITVTAEPDDIFNYELDNVPFTVTAGSVTVLGENEEPPAESRTEDKGDSESSEADSRKSASETGDKDSSKTGDKPERRSEAGAENSSKAENGTNAAPDASQNAPTNGVPEGTSPATGAGTGTALLMTAAAAGAAVVSRRRK